MSGRMELIEKIVEEVRKCGKVILNADRSPDMINQKDGHANYVTTYDSMIQEMLKKSLTSIMPEAVFVGEEEDIHASIESGYAFIVDPIDGTTNFIKNYKLSTVSVGLLKDGKPYLGVVYNPYLDEMFYALKGEGAFCNGEPIHVSDKPLSEGVVLFGSSPYYEELSKRSFELAHEFFIQAMDIRRSGSAAWDLCCIAAGRAELFFELCLSPWDHAGGDIIVTEAGGVVTQLDGSEIDYSKPCSVKVTNGK